MNILRRFRSPLFRLLPRLLSTPRMLTFAFFGSSYMYFNNPTVMMQKSQLPLDQFITFSDEEYTKLQVHNDVIVLIDPDRYQEEFALELIQIVEGARNMKSKAKRPIKVMVLRRALNQKLIEEFETKYQVTLEYDSLLLLKNKNINTFYVFTASDYFENKILIFKYFDKIMKINQKYHTQFQDSLARLPENDIVILVYADKSSPQYRNIITRLSIIKQHELYSKNQQLHWIIVDKYGSDKLNIKEPKDGNMYFLQRSSKQNYNKHNLQILNKKILITPAGSLTGKNIEGVMDQLNDAYFQNNIFANRSFGKQDTKYSIILEVDLNKVDKPKVNNLIEIFGELKTELIEKQKELGQKIELVYLNKVPKENELGYQIYIRDDELYAHKLRQHSEQDMERMKKLKVFHHYGQPHSYTYRLQQDYRVTKDVLLSLLYAVQNGMAEEYFQSQEQPKYRKYSTKLVASTFQKEVIDSQQDYAIFQYSKNCHACAEYGQYYENLALQSLKDNSSVLFGRLNNDRNKPDCIQDYPYTPVFMVCKNGAKTKPYVYRNQKFTPDLLKYFYDITPQFELIPEEQYQKVLQAHQQY